MAAVWFQSTPTLGTTSVIIIELIVRVVSIHPPTRRRRLQKHTMSHTMRFQSTHTVQGATSGPVGQLLSGMEFQSTHPTWGATSEKPSGQMARRFQSTHPYGATEHLPGLPTVDDVSIHTHSEGIEHAKFWVQSTLSGRRDWTRI